MTPRLIVRDHIIDDLDDYHNLISNPITMKYLFDVGTKDYEESTKSLKDAIEQSNSTNRKRYFFAIIKKDTNEYIGEVGFTILQTSPFGNKAELGYFIKKEFWNNGYTFEAAKAVLDFALANLKIHKMISGCILDNIHSEKIIKKLGFKKEAHLVKHVYLLDKWLDRVEYGLINDN